MTHDLFSGTRPLIARFPSIVCILALWLAPHLRAQGTLQFNFDAMPPGALDPNYFAHRGVEFISSSPYTVPSIRFAPPGATAPDPSVAYLPPRAWAAIRFDRTISSFSMMVFIDADGAPRTPGLVLDAMTAGLGGTGLWQQSLVPARSWQRVTFQIPPILESRAVEFRTGLPPEWWSDIGYPLYFSDIEVTLIPEPASIALLLLSAPFILRHRRQPQ